MGIIIKEVFTKSDLKKFINFQYELYKGNKFWCPPMKMDEMNTLSKDKNPSFDYCEARYWLAYKDDKIVGRIAGIINPKSNQRWEQKHIRFGWIEFINDVEVCQALLKTVEDWGKERGLNHIHGPLGFTDMDNEGMLVKGFDELSTMASIYNHEYFPELMEKAGYQKDADWIQYEFKIPSEPNEKVEKFANIAKERYGLRVLEVKKSKELLPYAKKMFELLNRSFKDLYGFTELTEKQMNLYVKQYFGFIVPKYICLVVDKSDEVVGFGVSLPSLTKASQKCKGNLFPFGFMHLLKALKNSEIIDMYLNGIAPEYQGKGVHAIYYDFLTKSYINNNVKLAITNPQLEENAKALNVWKHYDGRQHITRRCYLKEI
ncbi:MAG: hypothetical protein HXX09_03260 [Bacteroidetes bacterium]|nr:hypothetical protein [Bacteroidota bacterium]